MISREAQAEGPNGKRIKDINKLRELRDDASSNPGKVGSLRRMEERSGRQTLWELLQPIAFKIPNHTGRGLMYC